MKNQKQNLHEGHRKRLRQKFMSGKELFKEHELLELLLSYSIPRKNTNELAHLLLDTFGSLQNVLNADSELLSSVDGIGENSACFLSLVGYVSSLCNNKKIAKKELSSINLAKEHLIELFKDLDHEVFYVVHLNKNDKVIGLSKIDSKSKNSVSLDFNELSRVFLAHKPHSVIVAHNHFSKYPYPSVEDDNATQKLFTLLQLYQVNFYDHLIISGTEIYSYFYDNRLQTIKEKTMLNKL